MVQNQRTTVWTLSAAWPVNKYLGERHQCIHQTLSVYNNSKAVLKRSDRRRRKYCIGCYQALCSTYGREIARKKTKRVITEILNAKLVMLTTALHVSLDITRNFRMDPCRWMCPFAPRHPQKLFQWMKNYAQKSTELTDCIHSVELHWQSLLACYCVNVSIIEWRWNTLRIA